MVLTHLFGIKGIVLNTIKIFKLENNTAMPKAIKQTALCTMQHEVSKNQSQKQIYVCLPAFPQFLFKF